MTLEFYDIVKSDDIQVSIPKTSHFTIGTSPYYAHQHGLAIDIYHSLSLENYNVFSPISGIIQEIKAVKAPRPKFLGGIDKDFLILVKNSVNHKIIYKIMHVKSKLRVGDKIEVGDLLGKSIRNGYFAYWSSPHLHLEIRSYQDAIRARGGKEFTLAFESQETFDKQGEICELTKMPIEIHASYPEFILCQFSRSFYHKITPIYGIKVKIYKSDYILDGGIPHYKLGTVISDQIYGKNSLNSIFLGTSKIGTLDKVKGQFGFFKFDPVKFFLNDKEIRGISLFLANFFPLVKIIPYHKNDFSFKSKSIQHLSIA
ncbi:MAG: hypothetical protein ACFFEN_09685 [Candidatus Thorarchaeota archaeon]